jgi:hypothetical protein
MCFFLKLYLIFITISLRFLSGGHDGRSQLQDVWASADEGLSWTQVCHSAQWHGRQGFCTVALNEHLYIMGGFGGSTRFNDIWKSSDCGKTTNLVHFVLPPNLVASE